MENFSAQIGMPVDAVRYACGLFSSIPLSYILRHIPASQTTLRHLFSIITTSILIGSVFRQSALVELLFLCSVIYVLAYLFGSRRYGAPIIFGVAMSHMAYLHYEVQIKGKAGYIDYSAIMMVLLIKLSAFGFNVNDGSRSVKELDEYQIANRVEKFPSFIEFLGFCFFVNGVWVGPALEYRHYKSFIEGSSPYNKIPSTAVPAAKCMAIGLSMLAVEIFVSPHCHFHLLRSNYYLSLAFKYKIIYLTIGGFAVRAKFYAIWKIAEASALISGVGIREDPKTKQIRFDASTNVNLTKLEFGENVKSEMDYWNIYTALWLRRYVYVRVPIQALKLPSTFFVSAFWHGFYPGYYLTFLNAALLTKAGRTMRRYVRPIFLPGGSFKAFKSVYDILGVVSTMLCMNYLFLCFIVKRLDHSLEAWYNLYFIGHFLFVTPIFLLENLGLKRMLVKYSPKTVDKVHKE